MSNTSAVPFQDDWMVAPQIFLHAVVSKVWVEVL